MVEELSEAWLPENRKPWKGSWAHKEGHGEVPKLPKVPWG